MDCHAILHGLEPMSFAPLGLADRYFTTGATWEAQGWPLMSVFLSVDHYAMAMQGLNIRRHWVKGVPRHSVPSFQTNRVLKSPFLVNRGKVRKTAKPDVDMSQPPGTWYPLLYSRATHIQIMGNSCFPGPTVTSVGCAYDQREAARSRKVMPKICVGLTASSQLIQPPSTPMGRGPEGLSPLYR